MLEKPCYMFNPVNNCSIILVLFLITSIHSFQVTLDFEIPCNASTPTIAIVPFCPNNTQTYKDAADKKNCSAIPHMCKSFVYHCVRNKEKNALIEAYSQIYLEEENVPIQFFLNRGNKS